MTMFKISSDLKSCLCRVVSASVVSSPLLMSGERDSRLKRIDRTIVNLLLLPMMTTKFLLQLVPTILVTPSLLLACLRETFSYFLRDYAKKQNFVTLFVASMVLPLIVPITTAFCLVCLAIVLTISNKLHTLLNSSINVGIADSFA